MNKFKDMDKKKKITISVIAILILLIGSAIAIYGVSATKSDDGKAKVEKNVKLSEKEENKAKNLESEMDEKLKNAKTEEEKEAIKKEYAEKIEKATDGKVTVSGNGKVETTKPSGNNSSSSSSSGSSGSTAKPSKPSGGSTAKPSKPTEPEKKKVWVVDKPAWTETVKVPVYASRPRWFINFGNGNIQYYYDKQEWNNTILNDDEGKIIQYGNADAERYISHYVDEYIEHPEEGHWEYQ